MLDQFKQKQQQLLNVFEELENLGFLPCTVGNSTFQDLSEAKAKLQSEEFTISVCGQINAGKSTLLNYLLFDGEHILPADDTPWTAKLTTIQYAEKARAEATFYNQAEWDKLRQAKYENERGEQASYFQDFLEADVKAAAASGILPQETIQEKAQSKAVALEDLPKYVAKGGLYTPFVKQVDLYIEKAWMKGSVFVDTPGINDPNETRSKVTEEWIGKSSAVLYIFYTGQTLSKPDLEFIDTYLQTVPSNRIIFAVNKADSSQDYERAKAFAEKHLREDASLKERDLMPDGAVIYPISALAATLQEKTSREQALNEDERYHLKRLQKSAPQFLDAKGYVPELLKGIQSRIMANKGDALIEKAMTLAEKILSEKESELASKLRLLLAEADDVQLDAEGLAKKLKEARDINEKVEKLFKTYEKEAKKLRTTQDNQTHKELSNLKENVFKEFSKWVEGESAGTIARMSQQNLKRLFEKGLGTKYEHFNINPRPFDELIEGLQDELNKIVGSHFDFSSTLIAPVVSIGNLKGVFSQKLPEQKAFKNLKGDAFNWLRGNKNRITQDNILNAVYGILEEACEGIYEEIKASITVSIKEDFDEQLQKIKNEIGKRIASLDKLQEDKDELARRRQYIAADIAAAVAEKRTFDQYIATIKNML